MFDGDTSVWSDSRTAGEVRRREPQSVYNLVLISEHALDEIVDPDAADTGETDSTVTRPDESPSDGTDSAADDAETVELTIELY